VQIQNAVKDIEAKKEEILYLERLISECLQLLEIIGVLVHENGEKIDTISDRVR
jgi:t-SNARE complex subunit (syntaxin)